MGGGREASGGAVGGVKAGVFGRFGEVWGVLRSFGEIEGVKQ